jgi:DNA-binding NarL/FixJ family response regulator
MAILINDTPDLQCSHSFSSCEDALQQMESSPYPAVILLDIVLPGMSGLEGIEKFKQLAPSIQIIINSVYDDYDRVFQAICAGAAGYLLKTSSGEKVIEAIYDVLKGGSPINPQIARKILVAFAALNTPSIDYGLTDHEQEILLQMTKGLTKKEIGEELCLSHHTIDTHIRNIYNRLHVNNRSGAIAKALKERLF